MGVPQALVMIVFQLVLLFRKVQTTIMCSQPKQRNLPKSSGAMFLGPRDIRLLMLAPEHICMKTVLVVRAGTASGRLQAGLSAGEIRAARVRLINGSVASTRVFLAKLINVRALPRNGSECGALPSGMRTGLGVVSKSWLCAIEGILLLFFLVLLLFLLLGVKSGDNMLYTIRCMMLLFPSLTRCGLHVFLPEIIGLPLRGRMGEHMRATTAGKYIHLVQGLCLLMDNSNMYCRFKDTL